MENKPLLDELLDLLTVISRINRNLIQQEGRDTSMSLSAIQLQAIITMRRYGVLNMSELADHLLVTRPQLTKITGVLEERGLTRRKASPRSRREVLIELTDQGRVYIEESLLGKSGFLAQILRSLEPEQAEELRRAAATMCRIFAAAASCQDGDASGHQAP